MSKPERMWAVVGPDEGIVEGTVARKRIDAMKVLSKNASNAAKGEPDEFWDHWCIKGYYTRRVLVTLEGE